MRNLPQSRALSFSLVLFSLTLSLLGITGCQNALDEEEPQTQRQALDHEPHYDFENNYEAGYCGTFTDMEEGSHPVPSIDDHGLSFSPERRRPSWSEISQGRHYLDSESTVGYTDDGERITEPGTAQRIPDYRLVSNNFKLLNSLTLLLSSLTKVTDTINDLDENGFGEVVANFTQDSICQAYGDEIGHCICTTPGAQLPCGGAFQDGGEVLDSVGDAFNALPAAAGQAFESVAQNFINSLLNGTPNHTPGIRQALLYLVSLTSIPADPDSFEDAPDWLHVSLDPSTLADYSGITFSDGQSLTGPPIPLHEQAQDRALQWADELQGTIDDLVDAYTAAFTAEDPNFVCASATSTFNTFSDSKGALDTQILALPDTLTSAYGSVVAIWQQSKTTLIALWNNLKALWSDVKALWNVVIGAINADGLFQVNWSDYKNDIQAIKTSASAIHAHVQAIQSLIDTVTALYDSLKDTALEIQALATVAAGDAEALSQAFAGCAETFSNMTIHQADCGLPFLMGVQQDLEGITQDLCSYLSLEIDEPNSLAGRIFTVLHTEKDRIVELFEMAWQGIKSHFSADGAATLVEDLMSELLNDFFGVTLDSVLTECHARDTRCGCNEFCAGSGQQTYLWLPVDYAKNPASTAGAVGHFALEQTGFLDMVVETISNILDDYLGSAVSWAANAMGGILEVVERILKFFSDAFRYIDHFSSGYHIGAYSDLRPDLHMCVAFAGHSAYAPLDGGSDPEKGFSLGARYGHHQLSARHRVRFGTGGFAVQFRDKQLSLAPSIGIYKHIDGFRLWSQLRPLGLKIGDPSFTGSLSDIYANADSFHLTTPEEGVDGGQAFMTAFNSNGFGSALVRDLYPVQPAFGQIPSLPRPPGMGVWPRLPESELRPPPWDTAPGWEQDSDAVASLGLNLAVDFGEYEWSLPEIPVFSTGVFEATLRLFIRLAAGIGWWHETDLFLERIQSMVNKNLPEGFDAPALNYPEDFKRDMHAMQAPDLTAENGSYVYATPTIGAEISAKATFRIIELALRLGLSLGIKIEPGASAGIMDLNAALADVLQHSNPPQEAECTPVIAERYASFCTASRFDQCVDNDNCPDGSQCVSLPGSEDRFCTPICSDKIACPYGECTYGASSWHSADESYPVSGGLCMLPSANLLTYHDQFETTSCDPVHAGGSCGLSFFYEKAMNKPMLFCADNWLYIDDMDCDILAEYVHLYESGLLTLEELIGKLSEFSQLDFIVSTLESILSLTTTTPDPTPSCVLLDGTILEDHLGVCCLENGTCTPETSGACCTPGDGDEDSCKDLPAQACHERIVANGGGIFRPNLKCEDLGDQCMGTPIPQFALDVFRSDEPCGERGDAFDQTPYTTAYISVGTQPTCDTRGMCVIHSASGDLLQVVHGVSKEQCHNLKEHGKSYGLPANAVPTYTSYACITHAVVDDSVVTGWTGDGCHPLQQGFPSACGCTSDAGCMPQETCLFGTHEPSGEPSPLGQCVMADTQQPFSCAADNQDGCPNGRTFVNGSCVVPCSGPGTCEDSRVCKQVQGAAPNTMACHPPHDIVYAESVSWGMDNVAAPMHSIWTYSMADYMQLLLFGLTFKIDLQLPWPRKPISILNLGKTWDLGSNWKGWLQPGLQAHYQHECALAFEDAIAGGDDAHLYDASLSPITNYQPFRAHANIGTINPDQALDPDGLTGSLRCMGPNSGGTGVCRYRGDLDPTTALGSPASILHGNTNRSVGEFLDWCKQTMPTQAEFDAKAQSPEDFMESIADMLNWSYELGIDLFQETDVCFGDVPMEEFLGNLFETDGDATQDYTFTNETSGEVQEVPGVPNFATMDCEYRGQYTDKCPNGVCTFPCGELMDYAAEIWGCLDLDPTYWLHQMIASLEDNPVVLSAMSNPDWAQASFPPGEGFPVATTQMINPNNPTIMRPSLIDPTKMVLDFNALFHRGELGEYPLSMADMIGTFRDLDYNLAQPEFALFQDNDWTHEPPFRAHNIGRLWHMDFTTCMDEAAHDTNEFGCTCTSHADCGEIEPGSYCEFDGGPAPGVGICWKNQPTRLSDHCFDDNAANCQVICSATGQPPAEGQDCPDHFFFPECSPFQLVLDGEVGLCEEPDEDNGGQNGNGDNGDNGDGVKGACCVGDDDSVCIDVENVQACRNRGGSFHEATGCQDINYCKEELPLGACCLSDGACLDQVHEEDCTRRGGQFNADGDCSNRRMCMTEAEVIPTPETELADTSGCGGCSASGSPTDESVLLAILLAAVAFGRRLRRRASLLAPKGAGR